MKTMNPEMYKELYWFKGRDANLTTILFEENDYEFYFEGVAEFFLHEIQGYGQVIDISLSKEQGYKTCTFKTSRLKDYTLDKKSSKGQLIKTLTINMNDGSIIILSAAYAHEDDSSDPEVELSDEFVRFLFNLPIEDD